MQEEPSIKFIVDASFVLSFLFPDEGVESVTTIFDEYSKGKIKLSAPNLLSYEVINGLKGAILRKRMNLKEAVNLVEDFLNLAINLLSIEPSKVLELSVEKKLSVYDAAYFYLAKKLDLKLLTLDENLQKLSIQVIKSEVIQ